MLSKEKIEYFKKKLKEHKKETEGQLSEVARPNLQAPGEWETTVPDMNVRVSDKNELADTFEEQETREALEENLEKHLMSIEKALKRVDEGTFGICSICNKEISEERLEAYPMAEYCIKDARNKPQT